MLKNSINISNETEQILLDETYKMLCNIDPISDLMPEEFNLTQSKDVVKDLNNEEFKEFNIIEDVDTTKPKGILNLFNFSDNYQQGTQLHELPIYHKYKSLKFEIDSSFKITTTDKFPESIKLRNFCCSDFIVKLKNGNTVRYPIIINQDLVGILLNLDKPNMEVIRKIMKMYTESFLEVVFFDSEANINEVCYIEASNFLNNKSNKLPFKLLSHSEIALLYYILNNAENIIDSLIETIKNVNKRKNLKKQNFKEKNNFEEVIGNIEDEPIEITEIILLIYSSRVSCIRCSLILRNSLDEFVSFMNTKLRNNNIFFEENTHFILKKHLFYSYLQKEKFEADNEFKYYIDSKKFQTVYFEVYKNPVNLLNSRTVEYFAKKVMKIKRRSCFINSAPSSESEFKLLLLKTIHTNLKFDSFFKK